MKAISLSLWSLGLGEETEPGMALGPQFTILAFLFKNLREAFTLRVLDYSVRNLQMNIKSPTTKILLLPLLPPNEATPSPGTAQLYVQDPNIWFGLAMSMPFVSLFPACLFPYFISHL